MIKCSSHCPPVAHPEREEEEEVCRELVSAVLVTAMWSWGAERILGRKISHLRGLVVCPCEEWVILVPVALG